MILNLNSKIENGQKIPRDSIIIIVVKISFLQPTILPSVCFETLKAEKFLFHVKNKNYNLDIFMWLVWQKAPTILLLYT